MVAMTDGWNGRVIMNVGKEIRARRDAKGINRRDLADMCHVHEDALMRIEQGKRLPRLETLAAIADALEVRMTVFLKEP